MAPSPLFSRDVQGPKFMEELLIYRELLTAWLGCNQESEQRVCEVVEEDTDTSDGMRCNNATRQEYHDKIK